MKFSAPKGTKDILPNEVHLWQYIESVAREVFSLYGYKEIRTPIFEEASLFERSIGEDTDIVKKQMYRFFDKKGKEFVLRPENTASIVRACIQHSLCEGGRTLRVYYIGPMFRYEKPQKGRMRQFWQIGTEAIGCKEPVLDAETIQMVMQFFKRLGINGLSILINSIGCKECKAEYIKELLSFFKKRTLPLCEDCKKRENPLRILDCKVCKEYVKDAPSPLHLLCHECRMHFDELKGYLDSFMLEYIIEPHLVRGLDYYTRTCFEIIDHKLGAKNAIAAGGRYDTLFEELGGSALPCFGFAAGIERVILSLKNRAIEHKIDKNIVYVAPAGVSYKNVVALLSRLREEGINCVCDWEKNSLRSHLRLAQKIGAEYAIILGEEEMKKGLYILRCMKEGVQHSLTYAELLKRLKDV